MRGPLNRGPLTILMSLECALLACTCQTQQTRHLRDGVRDGHHKIVSNPTYYTILYHTIPYHTILYYNIIYHTILYYAIILILILISRYYNIPYYTILYYTIL